MYTDIIKDNTTELLEISNKIGSFTETERIEAVDYLNKLAYQVDEISELSFDIALKNDLAFLLCKFRDGSGNICKGGIKLQDSLVDSIEYMLKSIIEGQKIIKFINDQLDIIQANNGIILNVKYRWGFGKTSSIVYWDYTHIVIRLTEESITEMIKSYTTEESVVSLFKDIVWPDNILDFISGYGDFTFSRALKSSFGEISIEKALEENMLSINDVEKIIKQNSDKHSSQKLKSVHIISELGLFAAVLLWDIDYDTKDVSVDILENKVIDIENNRFVSDHSLYSRIEQRILEEADKVTKSFKTMASE